MPGGGANQLDDALARMFALGGQTGALMRDLDWAATPVGPPATWPRSLRGALGLVLGSASQLCLLWGKDFTQFYNDAFRSILGATKHPGAMGKPARETWSEVWDVISPMYAHVAAGGATSIREGLLLLMRNGFLEECYFDYTYSPVRDESSEVVGILAVCSEVTDRVLSARRLRALAALNARGIEGKSRELAAAAIAAALAEASSDVPFAIVYLASEAGDEMRVAASVGVDRARAESWPFGLDEREIELDPTTGGSTFPGAPWPEPAKRAMVLPLRSADSDKPHGHLVLGVSPRLPLDDAYREFLRLVASTSAGIVEHASSFEREEQRARQLAELDRAKTTFFGNASHELRTPLTLILGPVDDALSDAREPLPPAQRERMELVRRSGRRLQKLVDSLLDFARIEADRAHASFVPTDLSALTIELASTFASAFERAGLALRVDCQPLPEPVFADPTMWEKIVLNLLSNALKFTFEGEVRVSLTWLGDAVVLTVTDSGTGIPAEELPRVFDRFHRVEGARGRSHEGTGIGLALVRELVRLQGGTVDVTSEIGKGSTFTARLPTGSAHVEQEVVAKALPTLTTIGGGSSSFLAEVEQWNALDDFSSAVARTSGEHVLVVDDNVDMRGYLRRLLSTRWRVSFAKDGHEALAAAQVDAPDLVLADVMMPGLDGLALVRALRSHPRTQTIPIVLLSARTGEEATIEGLESGADAYLTKPFSAGELIARVGAQLSVSRLRREHAAEATRLLEHAERMARSREEILAVVSHDLRSPLSAIGTSAELLERSFGGGDRDERAYKRVVTILNAVRRMDRLLADLLDSASIEAGSLSVDPQECDLTELLRDLKETFEADAKAKDIVLAIESSGPTARVTCDRHRILQVLWNLVSNALKFTPHGGRVSVRADVDDVAGETVFRVADTGPGIPAEARAHVFDRYWHAARRDTESHGLGLAIAKGIVDAHGGRMTLEVPPSGGSVFSFAIPRVPSRAISTPPPPVARLTFADGGGEMGALTRSFDWSTTPLGAMAKWPQSLRTSVSTMLRSPYPITLFWGPELVMLYNDPFRPIHGEKHPETLGAKASEGLAEAWEVLGPLVAKTLASGEPMYVENGLVMFARRPGGLKEESYFTWSYNPTVGEDGGIAGLFAIASETTRQVIGERRLALLRELSLRTAFDKTVDAVFRSVEEVLAQGGADVPFGLLYVVEGDHARLAACASVERGSAAAPLELQRELDHPWPLGRVARSGNEELLSDIAGASDLPGGPWPEPATRALSLPIPIGDATASGVLVAGISPRLSLDDEYRSFLQLLARQVSASLSSARAYEQETRRAEQLAALDRAKTDFFSNVSHEFRTPLTLILGPIEDALSRPDRTLDAEKLDLVRRNALRLYRMVNALLDFSRIEAGRAQATFVPTDLATFTQSIASHFQSAADRAGLALVIDCAPLEESIYVDPEMWEKIVLNLLSNAMKYTYRGEIRVTLRWDGAAVLTVEDTGVGIAEDELPRVFERFYRVREAQGRSHEGTGIGLALARELVQLHGGTIGATSTPGKGSVFTVRVPRGAAHLPSERVRAAGATRTSASGAAAFVEEAKRWADAIDTQHEATLADSGAVTAARILLVDDNADLRSYVAGLLGQAFSKVETATNGREALEHALREPPDVILSDVMMPVMDGFALVRALRADERTKSIPIILLSARAGDERTVEGLESGADDYLSKPFSARELLARVRAHLDMARVRAEVWQAHGQVAQLVRSASARDQFLTLVAHELRTPLTALELQLDLLLRRTHDATAKNNVAVAARQTERLTRLVEMLLDVSRAATGTLELERESFDLAELARTVTMRFEGEARASNTRMDIDIVSAVRGSWDKRRIEYVLTALLQNAVKYAPGAEIHVAVRGGTAATVVVRDTGAGMSSDQIRQIFEVFERGVSPEHYGGFGVGLYLARQIVEAHGGTVVADSELGRGSAFTVTLPIERER